MEYYYCGICNRLLQKPLQLSCGHLVCSSCLETKCSHGVDRQAEIACTCPVPECPEDHGWVYHDVAVQREINVRFPNPGSSLRTLLVQQDELEPSPRRENEVRRPPLPPNPFASLRQDVCSSLTFTQAVKVDLEYIVKNNCSREDVRAFESLVLEAMSKCEELYPETENIRGIDFTFRSNFAESSFNIRLVNGPNLMLCKDLNLLQMKVWELLVLFDELCKKANFEAPAINMKMLPQWGTLQIMLSRLEASRETATSQRHVIAIESLAHHQLGVVQSLQNILIKDKDNFEAHHDENNTVIATWGLQKMSYRLRINPSVSFTSKIVAFSGSIWVLLSTEDGLKICLKRSEDCLGLIVGEISCPFRDIKGEVKTCVKEVLPLQGESNYDEANTMHLRSADVQGYLVEDSLLLKIEIRQQKDA